MTEPPLDPPPDPGTPPPQLPPAPQYPEGSPYPSAPAGPLPPPNPRPIRPGRVLLTILVVFVAHLAVVGAAGLFSGTFTNSAPGATATTIANVVLPLGLLALFIGCIGGGGYQLARGDRGIGVGLFVGWGISVLVGCGGACIAILRSLNGV
jgi:hypothetical protein